MPERCDSAAASVRERPHRPYRQYRSRRPLRAASGSVVSSVRRPRHCCWFVKPGV